MSLFLVRYGELGLKSPKVKKRFQKMLKKNIEDAFLKGDTQCITSMDWGRIYLHTDKDDIAKEILRKIFGITSFSKVIETTSDLEEICKTAAEYSKQIIPNNSTFAVRARRAGDHKYTSQEVAKEVGSAILSANKVKNLKVNLSQPDNKIFVEVRHNRAFIFSEKILGPGGFPIGSQGKVLAVISDRKSVYAAWLMMKRGCRTKLLCLDQETLALAKKLKQWHLNSKPIIAEEGNNNLDRALELAKKFRAEALVLSYTFEEFEKMEKIEAEIPIFYPLIGMSKDEIDKKINFLFGDGP
jgi:thiamine biosynthesis protein ThiI